MQCPSMDKIRRARYNELCQYDRRVNEIFSDNPQEVFNWLIGKTIDEYDSIEMYCFWCIYREYTCICKMSKQSCLNKDKTRIG